jgi:large subunit ribosomal protein L7/L12
VKEGAGVDVTPEQTAEQMTVYVELVCDDVPDNVVLLDAGPSPLAVAKAVRLMTGLGLWHAKQTVTAAPVLLFERVEEGGARQRAEQLRAAGASVVVEPWTARPSA